MIVSYYIIYTNHFDRSGMKVLCKMNNFDIVTSICPKYYCTQFSWKIEIKIVKVTFFTQSNLNFFH